MTTVFGVKMENFISHNSNIKTRFAHSIEYHCILKNLPDPTRRKRIALNFCLPHPKYSNRNKYKYLCLCSKNDPVHKKSMKIINIRAAKIITKNEYKHKLLVYGYTKSLNIFNKNLFESNIIKICFNYYYSKHDELNKLTKHSYKHFGIKIKHLDDLKALNRDKHKIKKLMNDKTLTKIIASSTIIRQIPRLLGPQLSRIVNFPIAIRPNDEEAFDRVLYTTQRNVSFRVKCKGTMPGNALSCVIGDIKMDRTKLIENILTITLNIMRHIQYGKNGYLFDRGHIVWKNCFKFIKKINIKTTHGKSCCLYSDKDIVSSKELSDILRKFNRKTNVFGAF
eukprot:92192_1